MKGSKYDQDQQVLFPFNLRKHLALKAPFIVFEISMFLIYSPNCKWVRATMCYLFNVVYIHGLLGCRCYETCWCWPDSWVAILSDYNSEANPGNHILAPVWVWQIFSKILCGTAMRFANSVHRCLCSDVIPTIRRWEYFACHHRVSFRFIITREWRFLVSFSSGQCTSSHMTGRLMPLRKHWQLRIQRLRIQIHQLRIQILPKVCSSF